MDTSRAAWRSTDPNVRQRMRAAILDYVTKRGNLGATCDETEVALGMSHQSCSARFADLRREGLVYDSGFRRPTRTGRSARVYRRKVSDPAMEGLV